MKITNKRNLVRQRVPLKDENGKIIGTKDIFHLKRMPSGAYKDFWHDLNRSPRKNSKRTAKKLKQYEEENNNS